MSDGGGVEQETGYGTMENWWVDKCLGGEADYSRDRCQSEWSHVSL
jgi:hypothetical protein